MKISPACDVNMCDNVLAPDRLGISSNTAKTRYYRGMSRLEAFLRERRKMHDEDRGTEAASSRAKETGL